MNKRVAVIGGRPSPIHGAKALGIDVVLLHEEGAYEQSVIPFCEKIVHVDITDGPAIVAALTDLHKERPFDRIMTTTETAGESTGYAVDHFGLPGVSQKTAHVLKDKVSMRDLLAKHDLSPVAYAHITDEAEAVAFVRKNGRSVLKPADGVASLHVHPCDDEASALEGMRALKDAGVKLIIIEEYLDGPVVSVDFSRSRGGTCPSGTPNTA